MPQLKSEGFVLKSVNWKENSRVLTFFTDNAGRQTVIDRGGRSLKSHRGRLLNFARLDITYFKSEKTGTAYVSEAEALEIFGFEKEGTLGRLTFASAAVELLYDLLPEDEPMSDLYYLTIGFFRLTDNIPKGGLYPLFIAYFMRLLSQLGYRPNFAGCVSCGQAPRPESGYYFFIPEKGGLVCSSCQTMGEYYIRLQSDRLEQICRLQTSSLTEASSARLKLKEAEEVLELLVNFLRFQTDKGELKSLKFLEKLKKTNY